MLKNKILITHVLLLLLLPFYSSAQTTPKKLKTIIVDAGHGGQDGGAHGGYEGGLNSWEKHVTLAISNKLVAALKKEFPELKIIPTRTTDIYQSPKEKADIANDNKGDLFICIHADAVELRTGKRQIGSKTVTRNVVTYTGKGKKRKKKITKKTETVPVYEYFKMECQRSGTSVWLFAAHKTDEKLKAAMNNENFEIETGVDSLDNIDFSTPEKRVLAQIHADRFQKKSSMLASLINEEVAETGRPTLGINQRQKGIWVLQATNMPAILIETGFICNSDDERYLNSSKGQQELAEAITKAVKRYKEQIENPGKTSGNDPVSANQ